MPRHITVVGAVAPSHVHPTLGLVRELTRRGHRVTYAIGEPLVPLVAGAGAEPVACTTLLPQPGTPWPEEAIPAMALFLDEGMHVLPQLTAALDGDPPDLVLHDIGGLASSGHGVPGCGSSVVQATGSAPAPATSGTSGSPIA